VSALQAALARASQASGAAAAATAAAPDEPAARAALAAVCAAGATAGEREVGERVGDGRLAWDEVWRDPHAHGPSAVRLVQRAIVLMARDLGPPPG
jgi:hypothetical protein